MTSGGLTMRILALKALGPTALPLSCHPRAYTGPWPIPTHRNMAQVDDGERRMGR